MPGDREGREPGVKKMELFIFMICDFSPFKYKSQTVFKFDATQLAGYFRV